MDSEKERNPATHERKTIYLAHAPEIEADVSVMRGWPSPVIPESALNSSLGTPDAEHVLQYLQAFYHGLPVKFLSTRLSFTSWGKSRSAKPPAHVGLRLGDTCVRIRTRASPDKIFARQLNLNDLLDAAIEVLPDDAYSILLLVEHDLYEDQDDDFCCGRTYGGSRVAVVSSARYHPLLDVSAGIDHAHMWPASHCKRYIDTLCGLTTREEISKEAREAGPLTAAVRAASTAPDWTVQLYGLWLSRLVRTASHELGHCLALDHCVYYACVMQGTAGMAEDVRQPPYLCPVCTSKLNRAILDVNEDKREKCCANERYKELSRFCQQWKQVAMFAGFGAWLDRMTES